MTLCVQQGAVHVYIRKCRPKNNKTNKSSIKGYVTLCIYVIDIETLFHNFQIILVVNYL